MSSLSVIIPGRNERFFAKTVETILANVRGDTEVIAVCDASWPDPVLYDHPRLTVLHYTESVGQRGGVNRGASVSRAKYVMKLDAHSSVDEGFDVKLMAPYESGEIGMDVTTIPRMYNLHGFDWKCPKCGWAIYQGPKPDACEKCKASPVEMDVKWAIRPKHITDFARFDSDMHFQYWRDYRKRPEAQGEICDVLSSVGACFFMPRDRFFQLGVLDENHGSWGQFGTEVSCKAWLSGGRQVVNKRTWFAHLFRTKSGNEWGFPYQLSGNAQERAREYSRDIWLNGKWTQQTRPLRWLIDKFWPVAGWTDEARNALPT